MSVLDAFKNFAKVAVSTGYDASATSIALSSGQGALLPAAPFNMVWWNSSDYTDPSDDPNVEIVRVTVVSGDNLTVTRAQESTSATSKNTSGKSYKMIAGLTAKLFNTDIPGMFKVESLAGTINSSNTIFTTTTNIINTAFVAFLGGVPCQPGVDFTITGPKQITMTAAPDATLSGQPFWLLFV